MLDQAKASIYSDVDGLSLQNLFFTKNGYFPNCFMFSRSGKEGGDNHFDTIRILEHFKETKSTDSFQYIKYVTRDITTKEEHYGICVIDYEHNIFARIENNVYESYILFANNNDEALAKFVDELMEFYVAPEGEKNNLYTIAQSNGMFSLIKQNISEKKLDGFDVNKQYNNDFAKEDSKIEKFINDQDRSGLVILHGEKGTGKTTYIRHLINMHPERKFVFVPSGLITLLGDPSFGSFLLSLNNTVIILEDCENAIRDRKTSLMGSSSAVSLLLNMTDGLLSDDLGIKFICTFNEDTKNIDSALMRKGRLISKYEFKPLSAEKANILLEELYKKTTEDWTDDEKMMHPMYHTDKALTLADIFNFADESYEITKKSII